MAAEDFEARCLRIHPDDRARVTASLAAWAAGGKPLDVEYRRRRKDGSWVWLRNRGTAAYERDGARYLDGMISDITEKKRLSEMVAQAQKMEAIGQLTGGIAHDFNNILASILANSHFLIDELGEQDPRRFDAEEIKLAAERAASLTRQLLAFSRRQVLEPKVVDLNVTVRGLEKMLRRLIGEDIELLVAPAADLGTVRVDVGQIEQVLMNLAVNARDAMMPAGGTLCIETANVELDEEYAAAHIPALPGRYVMLAVSDTGCGMDEEVRRRVFEPFFTTKELGKGTGLGLSTCYGIVKQSGGYIWVYSEPGHGSVFKVYLPRVDAAPSEDRRRSGSLEVLGSETVLVVEDDGRVRAAVTRILEERGYHVLTARDGQEALARVANHNGPLDLVLSDVIMPGMNGPEIVGVIRGRFAAARALYMSGYTDHAVLRQGVLDAGVSFIQKPFAPDTLARKVREVLGG
jgi:signal transduction histidine kinase